MTVTGRPVRSTDGSARSTPEAVQLVIFRLDDRRYALPLGLVERLLRAVDVTPLPNAPSVVLGVIDVHGLIVPVLNVRRRLGLPEHAVRPADWFLLAHTGRGRVVLVVDSSDGVVSLPAASLSPTGAIVDRVALFPGVVTLEDGLVLVHDAERFLSQDEQRDLIRALDDSATR